MADSEVSELSKTMIQTPKSILIVLNQIYELEQKIKKHGDPANLSRNVSKMKNALVEEGLPVLDAGSGQLRRIGFAYENPMGQSVNETRTDLDFTISGTGTENLVVVEVIKPIIRAISRDSVGEFSNIVQKGIVIVESGKEQ